MKKITAFFFFLILASLLPGCKDNDPETGKISIAFMELADGLPLVVDTVKYTNEAGNEYLVSEVQYFISNLDFFYNDGTSYTIRDDQGMHYIDTDVPDSKLWVINDDIPAGVIDSIVFTFGLDEETNVSGIFPNPPESNMFWPEQLGGGYHYMKLNGKWLNHNNELTPFNFHLGIGQTYDTTGQVTGFVQNFFKISMTQPVYSSFILNIRPGMTNTFAINLNIENWFRTPNTWDFNNIGGMIMQNQEAMHAACENGADVFTFGPYIE